MPHISPCAPAAGDIATAEGKGRLLDFWLTTPEDEYQVVPTADRQKATVQVKVSILDRDRRILPEMGAKVVFNGVDRGMTTPLIAGDFKPGAYPLQLTLDGFRTLEAMVQVPTVPLMPSLESRIRPVRPQRSQSSRCQSRMASGSASGVNL